ncbi:hypothetical protein JCM16106_07080 [Hydrogenophilus islandicus]
MTEPKRDPSYDLFQNYARHYKTGEERGGRRVDRVPDDLERLKRDRLPPWIDEIPKNARILDAGCAQGHLLLTLARVGFENLTGVDLSDQLLAEARAHVPQAQLIQADIREWLKQMPEGSFDVIFFHDVLEHLPREDTIEVLRGFYRLLAPGGRLSVRVPNMGCLIAPFHMAIDFTHITHFSEFSLLQVMEAAGFDLQKIEFESQAPRLFWSWSEPHRAVFRLLNHGRWHLNHMLHKAVYLLVDFLSPTQFDPNLIVVARK